MLEIEHGGYILKIQHNRILQEWMKNVTAGKMSKSDKLGQVDHSTMNYPPFRRSFYIEAQELHNMSEKEIADYRMQLEDIKVRGKDVPRPVKSWNQCGLSGRIMDVLKKSAFTSPMPIQVISPRAGLPESSFLCAVQASFAGIHDQHCCIISR